MPLSLARNEPLIFVSQLVVIGARSLFWIAAAVVAAALVATLFSNDAQLAKLTVKLMGEPAPKVGRLGLGTVLALSLAILLLTERFLATLQQIIATVPVGNGFVPANGDRLARMGWYALGLQLIAMTSELFSGDVRAVANRIELIDEVSIEGLLLVLLLFILARVFRTGAAMRKDLEGTV